MIEARKPPQIDNTPGIAWRLLKNGWQASWRARADLIKRGWTLRYMHLWAQSPDEPEPSKFSAAWMRDQCQRLQTEMLVWGRGGIPVAGGFDGTWQTLIDCFQTDKASSYRTIRPKSRVFYDTLCRRISRDHGKERIEDFKARDALLWHQKWAAGADGTPDQHIPIAHSLMGMVRTLVNFGADFLEDDECVRVSGLMHRRRFKQGKPREEHLSVEQVIGVRAEAHKQGRATVAMAQAFQFECTFRQKDVIGEWVGINELGISDITHGQNKWLRGIRWEEIDANLVLTHVTSKKQKEVVVDLRRAPMVIEELERVYGTGFTRGMLPASGPIIVSERTGRPWSDHEFRRVWRKIAHAAGVPKVVRNMDSRAGAVTEAFDAGALGESVRKAATHSTLAMTNRYSRNDAKAIANVMDIRVASRNKKGNPGA